MHKLKTSTILLSILGLVSCANNKEINYSSLYDAISKEKLYVELETTLEVDKEKTLDDIIYEISSKYNVDPYLIKSIIFHESSFNETSSNGYCFGLMQIYEEAQINRIKKLGVTNLFDPKQNILVGVDIFYDYYIGSGNNTVFALMQYNGGYEYAANLYNKGIISEYANSVIIKAEYYRNGGK